MRLVYSFLLVGLVSVCFVAGIGVGTELPQRPVVVQEAPPQTKRWQAVTMVQKPTSVKIVVLDTATGQVDAYEVSIFEVDEEIPQHEAPVVEPELEA